MREGFGLPAEDLRALRALKTPAQIQKFIDGLTYQYADTAGSPHRVLRERKGHCLEGALLAAAALRVNGREPLLMDLEAVHDDDHVIAIYREGSLWGGIAKSNFAGLRFRAPVYRTLRELALSYFESYYNLRGERTLRSYSVPTRTWEGGGEQAFWGQHIVFRASYFHNQFNRAIEGVGAGLVPTLLPNLTPAQQSQLQGILNSENAYSLDLNSLAFRAQGIEATVESGIGKNIFLRGGYTYLDSVVQHSFSSDNQALAGGYAPTFDGIPVGIYSPLKGARPFRRPPHTGFFTASYAGRKITGVFSSAFSSRSDDSTFLGYADVNQGNSLVLPNRNLDWGYVKLDLGASYKLLSWLNVYGRAENLTNNQHIAPIGYPSLPFTFRTGLRIEWTKANTQ
jgi:hypothetical protein